MPRPSEHDRITAGLPYLIASDRAAHIAEEAYRALHHLRKTAIPQLAAAIQAAQEASDHLGDFSESGWRTVYRFLYEQTMQIPLVPRVSTAGDQLVVDTRASCIQACRELHALLEPARRQAIVHAAQSAYQAELRPPVAQPGADDAARRSAALDRLQRTLTRAAIDQLSTEELEALVADLHRTLHRTR